MEDELNGIPAKLILMQENNVKCADLYRLTDGIELLQRAGIEVIFIDINEINK